MNHLTFRSEMPVAAEELFRWHARTGAFSRLSPPWQRVDMRARRGSIRDGDRTLLRLHVAPCLTVNWLAEHQGFIDQVQFQDRQVHGPFASFEHTHRMIPEGPQRSWLEDDIHYQLKGGWLGERLGQGLARQELERLFAYRHRVTQADLRRHAAYRHRPRLRILVSGASGMIGKPLCAFLSTGGHTVVRLVREGTSQARPLDLPSETVCWNPERSHVPMQAMERFDAVIHLAAEPITEGRWSGAKRRRIWESRQHDTRLLAESLTRLHQPPSTFLAASAIGYYGDEAEHDITEDTPPGPGFLSRVCMAWEEAALPAQHAGLRTANLRIGMVLSPDGGALQKMLPFFKLGMGGRLGEGQVWHSWISLDDTIYAIHHVLMEPSLSGPVNVAAPQPSRQKDFAAALAHTLGRPCWGRMPAWLAEWLWDGLAKEILLASRRVIPRRLLDAGFRFEHPSLPIALAHMLGKTVRVNP